MRRWTASWMAVSVVGLGGTALAGVPIETQPKMGDALRGLTPDLQTRFDMGKDQYGRVFEELDGLGPIYTNLGCGLCHENPLGGSGTPFVENFGHFDGVTFDPLVHLGGPNLQPTPNDESCDETIPPEANVISRRVTPGAMGYGLVEAILDTDLLALETSGPVISGRARMVEAVEAPGIPRVGRFGWKSQIPTILHFSADAAVNEIGLTNRFFMDDPDPNGDLPPDLGTCDTVADPEDVADGEGFEFIDRVTDFQRLLAPPPQTPQVGMTGETVFNTVGCNLCHTPSFTTSNDAGLEDVLRNKVIQPYSNFLLHDMGDAGDGISDAGADRFEMRTSPLWGLRQRDILWHDGRFDDADFSVRVTQAIQEHGAPGSEAVGVAAGFDALSASDKDALIAFLDSLGRREFDHSGDNEVTLVDFIAFAACFGGGPYTPDDPCSISDVDMDGDVDLDDYAAFRTEYTGVVEDCNLNGTDDLDDIINGTSVDTNGNGVPDECDPCATDITGAVGSPDGLIDFFDLLAVLSAWGPCPAGCPEDVDGNLSVGFTDLLAVLAAWGPC